MKKLLTNKKVLVAISVSVTAAVACVALAVKGYKSLPELPINEG